MGCTARRKSKKNSDYSLSENGEGSKKNGPPRTTRGGLRVYKIVILGDGGVGKSGGWCFSVCDVVVVVVVVCSWTNFCVCFCAF